MSTEKPLALRLLNAFEHYYFENACLRLMMQRQRISGWENELEKLMSEKNLFALVQNQFSEVRAALNEEGSEESALQRLLAIFPPNKDLN